MSTRETLAVYDQKAQDYQNMAQGRVSPGLAEFIGAASPGARVLDLGCGPGQDAAQMAAAGLDVLAVDGSAQMVALAARQTGVTAQQATFDEIQTLGSFGGIWANFSLLHATKGDFADHLRALHRACTPGAPLGLGMKLGEGAGPDPINRYYAYYSETELRDHLGHAGFTPVDARYGTETGLAGTTDDWIQILAHA